MDFRLLVGGLILATSLSGGCSNNSPERVNGTVIFDGQPLADGIIRFESLPDLPPAAEGGVILNGQFEIRSTTGFRPGKYQVVISARSGPTPISGPPGEPPPPAPELIPSRYNTATTLTAEIKRDGPNTFTFTLER